MEWCLISPAVRNNRELNNRDRRQGPLYRVVRTVESCKRGAHTMMVGVGMRVQVMSINPPTSWQCESIGRGTERPRLLRTNVGHHHNMYRIM